MGVIFLIYSEKFMGKNILFYCTELNVRGWDFIKMMRDVILVMKLFKIYVGNMKMKIIF